MTLEGFEYGYELLEWCRSLDRELLTFEEWQMTQGHRTSLAETSQIKEEADEKAHLEVA